MAIDAHTKGGTLESGTSYKDKIMENKSEPNKADGSKMQRPKGNPEEKAPNGHTIK